MQPGDRRPVPAAAEPGLVTVAAAVQADLDRWERRRPGIASSALAAAALRLAARMDDPSTSATAVSYCANALQTVLGRLEAQLPPEETADSLDELRARREKRRAG